MGGTKLTDLFNAVFLMSNRLDILPTYWLVSYDRENTPVQPIPARCFAAGLAVTLLANVF